MDKLSPKDTLHNCVKLEVTMEKRMLDTFVNITMFCNQCKNILEETYLQSF